MKNGVRTSTVVLAVLFSSVLALGAGCSKGNDAPGSPTGAGAGNFHGRLVRAPGANAAVRTVRAAAAAVPVTGAQIVVDGVPTDTFTDSDGSFELSLSPGPHVISVVGVPSARIDVNLDGLKEVNVELQLNADGTLSSQQDKNHDGDIEEADDQNGDGNVEIDEGDGGQGDHGNHGNQGNQGGEKGGHGDTRDQGNESD